MTDNSKIPTRRVDGLEDALDSKQGTLTSTQLDAVNSGITASKVSTYDGYATGKQNALSNSQLSAVNSGITTALVEQISTNQSDISDLTTQLASKQDTLTSENAGTGIDITNGIISNTQTSAEWGNITGTLSNQTDLQNSLNSKQDTLVSGTNIKTINNEPILGSGDITITSSPDLDNTTITLNDDNELQVIGIVNKNTATGATNPVYDWVGTLQEYETQQVETLHPDWICCITDDVSGGTSVYTKTEVNTLLATKANSTDVNNAITAMLEGLYPVGSIYIGTTSTCPIASLISGSMWTLVSSDRVLQGSSGSHTAGSTIEAGLPNIDGKVGFNSGVSLSNAVSGAIYSDNTSAYGYDALNDATGNYNLYFDASKSNPIYGNSTTVQPPAYVVNIWQRTA